jgi:UDP-N-acetylmuramoyl-L-alanyl-D-glutamate--2,6-diaminopimelate ligase
MEKILNSIKKIVPKSLFNFLRPIYHYKMALLGALIYRFPSRRIKVIGVTGTKGKSSVVEILFAILEEAGFKAASAGTVRFKIGKEVRPNLFKMTMPGRFFVQKFLRQAVDAGCQYAIIEMTSEGARQHRHQFVNIDALIFTNIAPEHIESHGSYENYLKAKLSLARALSKSPKKEKFMIANVDDKETAKFFEAAKNAKHLPYSLKDAGFYKLLDTGVEFTFEGQKMFSHLRGTFNIYNILAAATYARTQNVSVQQINNALSKLLEIPGRVQSVRLGNNFDVIVDYAHTPDSLRSLYEAFPNKKLICVLGNTGGGRDTWKRPEMGSIADRYCDEIILTNEDPYDEDPRKIVDEMATKIKPEKLTIEMDRRKAIKKSLEFATTPNPLLSKEGAKGVVVLITGKGTDPYIMGPKGAKMQWDDKTVVEEELKKLMSDRSERV